MTRDQDRNNPWVVVFNVRAGSNSRRKADLLKQALDGSQIPFEWLESSSKEAAKEEVIDLANQGRRHFLAVGGDGTNNATINALMGATDHQGVNYALLPWGTGNDWAVHLGLTNKVQQLVRAMGRQEFKQVDLGEIVFTNEDRKVYFTNTVGMGFDSFVVDQMAQKGKIGKVSYLMAILKGLGKYDALDLDWHEDTVAKSGSVFSIHLGLGPTTGGGLKITPHAVVRGERLAITIVKSAPKWQYATNLINLIRGRIEQLRFVDSGHVEDFHFPIQSENVLVECDGEACGSAPFKIRLSDKKLNLLMTS